MAEVIARETVDVAAPPEAAYAVRVDFMKLSDYNPNVSNVRRTDGGSTPGEGAVYTFDLTLPGMDVPMPNTLMVTEAVAPSRVVCEIDAGIVAREVCTFTPAPGGGTHIEFEGTIFVPDDLPEDARSMIERMTHEQDRLELDLIKKILEG